MRTALKWTVLALGFFILVYVGSIYIRLADAMRYSGGIEWTWDFLGPNLIWLVIAPLVGLIMFVTAFVLLVRNGR